MPLATRCRSRFWQQQPHLRELVGRQCHLAGLIAKAQSRRALPRIAPPVSCASIKRRIGALLPAGAGDECRCAKRRCARDPPPSTGQRSRARLAHDRAFQAIAVRRRHGGVENTGTEYRRAATRPPWPALAPAVPSYCGNVYAWCGLSLPVAPWWRLRVSRALDASTAALASSAAL